MTNKHQPSLFHRLGDLLDLARVVHRVYDRVIEDSLLRPFFEDNPMGFVRSDFRDFLAQHLGGPPIYGNRPLELVHAGMGIEDAHFDRFLAHMAEAMRESGVDGETITPVISSLQRLRPQVVQEAATNGRDHRPLEPR